MVAMSAADGRPDATSPSVLPSDLRVRVVGDGRAGGAISGAFTAIGLDVHEPVGRTDDVADAAVGVDLIVVATPDPVIADVAAQIRPDPDVLIVHLAGALGPGVLGEHSRRGVLHPLVSLPDPVNGAERLGDGAWFAVDADQPADRAQLESIVHAMGGHSVHVSDAHRTAYHAAAVIASNHLVALVGQVERVAHATGVPLEAYLALACQTLAGLGDRSPAEALTGPVARGDWATVRRHLDALDATDRPTYAALAEAAAVLVDAPSPVPEWLRDARCGRAGAPGDAKADGDAR